jgi:GH35 family endo-1,4-beta-xylanase
MTAELGLSAEQAAKVRTALTAQQRTADSVMARRAAAQDAERAAMLAMHTNTEKALAGILTPDQKLKHDAMRARQGGRDGMRRGGPARGARRDGRDDRRGPRDDRRSR